MSGNISPDIMGASGGKDTPLLNSTSPCDHNYSSIDHLNSNATNEQREENSNSIQPSVNFRSPSFSYEELSNGLTCPTCKGTGKIPRGQEDDLVALIPYRDDRLKPRRTWLYVSLSFIICIALAGGLSALLIPRSVDVVQDNVTTLYVDLNVTRNRCFMTLQSTYNVTNNNFVAVNANDFQLDVTVMFYQKMVLNQKFVRNQRIGIRSTQQVIENFNITLNRSLFPIDYCKPTQQHDNHIFMKFQTTFNFTLMAQTDQQVVIEYFRIDCNPEDAQDAKKLDASYNDARMLFTSLE
ncbi:transmembrane protein 106B-like [Asterias amurensis]|uniref:transmembrane protein 106B-like n=1 Tax=Asterias amurensis TaxID=7602 RepID=UPI003AB7DD3D